MLFRSEATPIHYSVLHSAGALYSTAEDLLKWEQALATGTVLSRASVAEMLTPHAERYGYGVVIDSLFGRRHVYHGGFLDGFNSTFERWPDQKLCVIVLSNDDMAPVKKIAHGLAAIVFGEPHDVPVKRVPTAMAREELMEFQGVFDLGLGRYRHTLLEGDTLHMWVTGEPRVHLFPLATDTFFLDSDNTILLSFVRDDFGEIKAADLRDEGITYRAPRVEPERERELLLRWRPIALNPALFDDYAGVYQLETGLAIRPEGFTLTVTREGRRLFVAGTFTETVELFARSETEFFHQTADFTLEFERDGRGNVSGCVVRMAGAAIRGRKVA